MTFLNQIYQVFCNSKCPFKHQDYINHCSLAAFEINQKITEIKEERKQT